MSKIALVHDYFVQMGGAERVAEAMHDSFPSAPMYTTAALPNGFEIDLGNSLKFGAFSAFLIL